MANLIRKRNIPVWQQSTLKKNVKLPFSLHTQFTVDNAQSASGMPIVV